MSSTMFRKLSFPVVVMVASLLDMCSGGRYCLFLHEDYYVYREIYCESGCCSDYGEDDEICCFTWTVGIILGIGFACVAVIVGIIVAVICCSHMKKRNGHVVHPGQSYPQNNTVVYTNSVPSAPPYNPYNTPSPGYYPGTQFNSYPAGAPPPYTAATQPAYMPTPLDQSNSANRPEPDVLARAHAQRSTQAPSDPAYPPSSNNIYGGYGTGQNTS